jgi:hypothetical protein
MQTDWMVWQTKQSKEKMKYSFETTSESSPNVSLWPAVVNEIRSVINSLKSKKLHRYVGATDMIIQKLHM